MPGWTCTKFWATPDENTCAHEWQATELFIKHSSGVMDGLLTKNGTRLERRLPCSLWLKPHID